MEEEKPKVIPKPERETFASGGGSSSNGSFFQPQYGRLQMKTYLITEDQFGDLFSIGLLATIFLSLATGLFGFSADVFKDLALSDAISESSQSLWVGIACLGAVLSIVFLILGVFCIFMGHNKISKIKKNTIFPDDQ